MEFISLGGLLSGLSIDDIQNGISQPRNQKLAAIFHLLHFIESYGTGIRKIYNLYQNCRVKPRMEVTTNTFKIVLPNINAQHAMQADRRQEEVAITPQMQRVLTYIEEHGEINDIQLQELLNIKSTRDIY